MLRAVVLFLALIVVIPASAATIHVARDGSGEFTTIQAAVDAAASGDTIMIGPGRYNEGAIVTCPGWTEFVRVLVRQDELTLIGAGPDQSIIGPTTPWTLSQGWNVGIQTGPYWGSRHVLILGLGFENMAFAVRSADASEATTIRNCRFYMNAYGLMFYNGGALDVSDCTFDFMPRNYRHLTALGMQSVRVSNCQFNLAAENIWRQKAVHVEATSAADFSGCAFEGGDSGMALVGVGLTRIDNCVFNDQTSTDGQNPMGVEVVGGTVIMSNCIFDAQTNAIFASESPDIEITNTRILSTSETSLNFETFSSLKVHDCVLAHGPRYTVWQEFPCDSKVAAVSLPHLDMINNDWGTSNADSIAAWIRTCEYVVDYVPFMGQPVPMESTSWGNLKAQYR